MKLPTPQPTLYRETGPLGGRINARIDSGAQLSTAGQSLARGFGALAGGLDAWADVLEKQEQEKQTVDAMHEVQLFQDRERDMLTQMAEMKGEAGFRSTGFAKDFYDREYETLAGQAKGDFQRMYYEQALGAARDQGLNLAVEHRTREFEAYKESTFRSGMDTMMQKAAATGWTDESLWAVLSEGGAAIDLQWPGEDNQYRKEAFYENAVTKAVGGALVAGDGDRAQALLDAGVNKLPPETTLRLREMIERQTVERARETKAAAGRLPDLARNEAAAILDAGVDNPRLVDLYRRAEAAGALPEGSTAEYERTKAGYQEAYQWISKPEHAALSYAEQLRLAQEQLKPDPVKDMEHYDQRSAIRDVVVKNLAAKVEALNKDPLGMVSEEADQAVKQMVRAGVLDDKDQAAVFRHTAAIRRRLAAEKGAGVAAVHNAALSAAEVAQYGQWLGEARNGQERLARLAELDQVFGDEAPRAFAQLKVAPEEDLARELAASQDPDLRRLGVLGLARPEYLVAKGKVADEAVNTAFGAADGNEYVEMLAAVVQATPQDPDSDAARRLNGLRALVSNMALNLAESGVSASEIERQVDQALGGLCQGRLAVNSERASIYLTTDAGGQVRDREDVLGGLDALARPFGDDVMWINDGDDRFALISRRSGLHQSFGGVRTTRVSRADAALVGGSVVRPGQAVGDYLSPEMAPSAKENPALASRREKLMAEVMERMAVTPPADDYGRFVEAARANSLKEVEVRREAAAAEADRLYDEYSQALGESGGRQWAKPQAGGGGVGGTLGASMGGAGAVAAAAQGMLDGNNGKGGMVAPLGQMLVTSRYGPRNTGIEGASRDHQGLDLRAPIGTPVAAAAGGVVETATYKGKNGNYVVIRHDDGRKTYYLHLDGFEVTAGQRVEAGQMIARSGNSGDFKKPLSPHLDFRVWEEGKFVDPTPFFSGLKFKDGQGTGGTAGGGLRPMVDTAAREEGVPADLVLAVIKTESGFNPRAVSGAGARGLMQLMPGTARDLGVDPDDPADNVRGGTRYLARMMRRYGDLRLALMAYNWGPGNLDRWLKAGGAVPAETRNYVDRVTGNLKTMQGG